MLPSLSAGDQFRLNSVTNGCFWQLSWYQRDLVTSILNLHNFLSANCLFFLNLLYYKLYDGCHHSPRILSRVRINVVIITIHHHNCRHRRPPHYHDRRNLYDRHHNTISLLHVFCSFLLFSVVVLFSSSSSHKRLYSPNLITPIN